MSIKMYTLFLCTCLSLTVVSHSLPHGHIVQRRGSNRFCGEILTDVLALICNNVYYSPQLKKGGEVLHSGSNEPWWRRKDQKETGSVGNRFVDSQVAMTLLDKREHYGRVSRGASDECCKKPCTYSELSSYCGNDGDLS